jgi:hypothetical protein
VELMMLAYIFKPFLTIFAQRKKVMLAGQLCVRVAGMKLLPVHSLDCNMFSLFTVAHLTLLVTQAG